MEKELDNFKKIVDKVLESKSATTFIAREFKKQGEKTTAGKNSAFIGRLKHVSDPYVDKQVHCVLLAKNNSIT
jgi:hypothetical protein